MEGDAATGLAGSRARSPAAAHDTPAQPRLSSRGTDGRDRQARISAHAEASLCHAPARAFRAFIERSAQRPPEGPRSDQYDEGYAAHQAGPSPVDNPYPPDTIDRLAWENGWFEARDEEAEHERATFRGEPPLPAHIDLSGPGSGLGGECSQSRWHPLRELDPCCRRERSAFDRMAAILTGSYGSDKAQPGSGARNRPM
jgi:hypothetical protein